MMGAYQCTAKSGVLGTVMGAYLGCIGERMQGGEREGRGGCVYACALWGDPQRCFRRTPLPHPRCTPCSSGALLGCRSLTSLTLVKLPGVARCVPMVSAWLEDPGCHLQRLTLNGCDLSYVVCGKLGAALAACTTLTTVNLRGNRLGDTGAWIVVAGWFLGHSAMVASSSALAVRA